MRRQEPSREEHIRREVELSEPTKELDPKSRAEVKQITDAFEARRAELENAVTDYLSEHYPALAERFKNTPSIADFVSYAISDWETGESIAINERLAEEYDIPYTNEEREQDQSNYSTKNLHERDWLQKFRSHSSSQVTGEVRTDYSLEQEVRKALAGATEFVRGLTG